MMFADKLRSLSIRGIALLLAIVMLLLCNLEGMVHATSILNELCGSSCQPHTQAEQALGTRQAEKDDKDPIPPAISWPPQIVPLAALYSVSVYIGLQFIHRRRLFLSLSTLRF